MKIMFFATHPVQYQVPIYRELSKQFNLLVAFMMKQTPQGQSDAGFGVKFEWDIPLFEGYTHIQLKNLSNAPYSSRMRGVVLDESEISKIINVHQPRVILVHGWFPYGTRQVINYCHRHNIPVISRGDSNLKMTAGHLKNFIKKYYLKKILSRIDHFLEVGIENSDFYDYHGIPVGKRSRAPHCIETEFFEKEFKDCSGKPPSKLIRIGMVGKIIQIKRPLDLLKAIALSQSRERIMVVVVGDGSLRREMENFAVSNNIQIEFKGFLNQSKIVKEGYCHMDLLALCSAQETWGLVVNEAMTGGIPAICSDQIGCVADLVEEGSTGFIYPSENIVDLAAKIDEFISRHDQGWNFSLNVRQKIAKYSLKEAVKGYTNAIMRFE